MEEATAEGPKITKQPCFGAQYMLFRACARRESLLVAAKTAAAAAHGQCGQMWHFDCQRYYSPLRACSGHTFTTCIHPGFLVAKVGNFGVKSAKVPQGQMGTKLAKVSHLAANLLKYVKKNKNKKSIPWVRTPVYLRFLTVKRAFFPLDHAVQ